ncbi:unnamed protein product [Arabidopsis lyrata]|uniref:No apical meristem-associated C-terminal domain-containing protein n=1 Tax=Arabidopsis lyrata subsp. lyrata TaxID=81972 RepID=D7LCQ4_ARALL|nr:hypothetical protein ARALYDRAFT_901314 [Arabidopsis lyrata subsp. lyrata]CAH8263638.1 unnamed protein product [Arabidopsis lyrata]
MDISQDPIKGVYQSSINFWARVKKAYDNGKNAIWSERTLKSIQCRIQAIEKATKKLHPYIRQCENRHQSDASNDDIFKDGVTPSKPSKLVSIQCDFGYTSLESDTSLDSPTQTFLGLSSFSLNDDDEITDRSSSPRPNGVKKSKMKRKLVDQTTSVINTLEEGNKQFLEQLKKTSAQREDHLEMQKKKLCSE